jgi:hypothetical protein
MASGPLACAAPLRWPVQDFADSRRQCVWGEWLLKIGNMSGEDALSNGAVVRAARHAEHLHGGPNRGESIRKLGTAHLRHGHVAEEVDRTGCFSEFRRASPALRGHEPRGLPAEWRLPGAGGPGRARCGFVDCGALQPVWEITLQKNKTSRRPAPVALRGSLRLRRGGLPARGIRPARTWCGASRRRATPRSR